MVDYNPASINKLNKRYGGGYESEAYGGSKETFYNKGGFNKIQKSDLDDDTSSGYNQFKRKQTNQGLGSPTNNINNKDDDDDKDVGGVGAFFSRVFSWANESGLEFKKPDRPRPSVLYDRDDMKPIDFDAMDKRIADAVNFDLAKPMPSMNFKDDEYAQSTYDEVQPLEGADTYKARRITAQGINDTIKGLMDTERRQADIKQAVNKTIDSLRSADANVPYVIQAGDTLSDIAAKTGTTVQDLVKRNKIKDKEKIYTGNELIIPTDKTTKSKEDVVSSLVGDVSNMGGVSRIGSNFQGEGVEVAGGNQSVIGQILSSLGLGNIEEAETTEQVIETVADVMPKVENPLNFIFKQGIVGLDEKNVNHQKTIKGFLNTAVPGFVKNKSEVTSGKKAWCGAFVNHVLENLGVDSLNTKDSYDKLRAKKYLDYGEKVSSIDKAKPGDLVITKGPEGFHVTFFTSKSRDGNTINALGGNQSNRVQVSEYSTSDIQGIRRIGNIGNVDTETIKSLTTDIVEGKATSR